MDALKPSVNFNSRSAVRRLCSRTAAALRKVPAAVWVRWPVICPGQLRRAIVSSRLANSITAIHYNLHINYNLNNYNLKRHPGSFRVVRSLQNPGSAAVFLFFILAIISYRAISTPS